MNDESDSGSGRNRVILFLVLLLLGSVGLYFSNVSLRSLLFGISSQNGEKVAVVKAVSGKLKRQPKDSLEFLDSAMNADLFDEDTVMTGREDRATLELFDGSILELDPESLIRLSFEKTAGVNGIERKVLVDIVAGNVRGDINRPKLVVRRAGQVISSPSSLPSPEASPASTPSPEPSPSMAIAPEPSPAAVLDDLKIAQPKAGQVYVIPTGQSPPLKQPLVFTTPSRPTLGVRMVLKNGEGAELLQKDVTAVEGKGGLLATFEKPGRYSLELLNLDGSVIGQGISVPFTVSPEFQKIETLAPLVGGEAITSNQFTGKRLQDFAVTLRWKPIDGAEKYRVVVLNKAGKKLFDLNVRGTSYDLPKGKVTTDAVNYQILAPLPSGYIAVSKKENFLFKFSSPALTLPKNGEVLSLSSPENVKQKGILLSWQRTTFTDAYEFEIAFDPQFKNIFKQVTLRSQDNFLIFRNLKPREYWWRVRSVSGETKSPVGPGFKFTVTP